MGTRGRAERSRRVRVASGGVVAALALLGSGLVPGSGPAASAAESPAAHAAANQPSQAERRAYWGAIKLAKDGTTGKATNRRTERRAMRAAGRKCRSDTPYRCNTATVSVSRACGAIAVRMRNGFVIKAVAQAGYPTRRRAARATVRACRSDGRRCRVAATVCTRGR